MTRWNDNWDAISPIFKFSKDVRTAFYTTNSIESLNFIPVPSEPPEELTSELTGTYKGTVPCDR